MMPPCVVRAAIERDGFTGEQVGRDRVGVEGVERQQVEAIRRLDSA